MLYFPHIYFPSGTYSSSSQRAIVSCQLTATGVFVHFLYVYTFSHVNLAARRCPLEVAVRGKWLCGCFNVHAPLKQSQWRRSVDRECACVRVRVLVSQLNFRHSSELDPWFA